LSLHRQQRRHCAVHDRQHDRHRYGRTNLLFAHSRLDHLTLRPHLLAAGSVFIANAYGIDVQDLAPINMTVENTVIVGNLQFGVRAGNNSVAVFTNSSVYR
jgi:hypothetical protein